jgi:hypothetical protein
MSARVNWHAKPIECKAIQYQYQYQNLFLITFGFGKLILSGEQSELHERQFKKLELLSKPQAKL